MIDSPDRNLTITVTMQKKPLGLITILVTSAAVAFLPFRATADTEYVTVAPVAVNVAGQTVQLPAEQAVTVLGTPANGFAMVRVQLPSGAMSVAQVPVASLRLKNPPPVAAKPAATTPAPTTPAPAPASAPAKPLYPNNIADASKFKNEADAPLHKEWKLIWEDDFSKAGGKLDTSKWNIAIDGKGNGNQERQYYTDDAKNVKVENGMLTFTAIKEKKEWANYTSGKITSKGKFSVQYGRIEACIKSPKGQQGSWPAFWMMPEESAYGGWPRSGEIDIMEMVNKCDTLHGTLHFGGNGHQSKGTKIKIPSGDYTQDFHVYSVEWEPNVMRWYVDGKYYGSVKDWSTNAPFPAPFDKRFYLILNFAVGGQWPKDPDNSSEFPQSMLVKWVRVYQPAP